jgi:hypothetical protein
LSNAIEDTHCALFEEFKKKENVEVLMSALGKDYDNTLTDLKVLAEKEENEGTFAAIVGAIDSRTPE